MKSNRWIAGFFIILLIPLTIVASWVATVDPYIHYHKPYTSKYFYQLWHQRSQNDGITRNFNYQGLITGTSMTECFKTTDAELFFGVDFIKVPYSGATFNEINKNLKVALTHNDDLSIVIRGLDMDKWIEDKNAMRYDLGDYPDYLYNEFLLDDVYYVFNRDVVFNQVYGMVSATELYGIEPGITSFDEYSNWMGAHTFGVKTIFPDEIPLTNRTVEQPGLTNEEKEIVIANVRQNVTSLAEQYPDVTFYYFIPPYSAVWWQEQINSGTFEKKLQAEQIAIEEILKIKNIKLYSFNNLIDVTSDLNNYKDNRHYAEWINSLILRYIKDGKCLLTVDNYQEYLQTERDLYLNFDYEGCFSSQEDYDDDYYALELLYDEIYGNYSL